MKTIFLITALIMCVCNNGYIFGQEYQIPFDKESKILIVDSKLNQEYHLFDIYEGFSEARLYKLSDTSYSIEINYKIDEKLLRDKIYFNSEEFALFSDKVNQSISDARSKKIDQSGRTELLWGLTFAGLGIYGLAATNITNTDGGTLAGIYMLTSAASFLIPYAITDKSPVSSGAARLSVWGSYSGVGHGAILYNMLGISKTTTDIYPDGEYSYTSTDYAALWGLIAFSSIAEAVAGYYIAENNDFSEGKSDMMISASIASTGILPGIAYLAGVEDSKVLSGAALVGTFSGYALANYISNTQNYSRGDAMCFSNIWALSAAVPVSLLVATKSEEPKLYVGGAILGAGLGMWLGDELVKGKEFSTSQGVYMWLGSFGGAFVLGGTALLAISDNNDTWQYIPTIMSIGAIGGFALTYSAFYDDPKIQEKKLSSDLRLDFNPMALTSAFSGAATNNPLQYYYSPLVKLTYKF